MKRHTTLLLTLALLGAPLALGAPVRNSPEDPRVQLLAADNTLKNVATALEMYGSDHDHHFPQRLSELVEGHYLRSLDQVKAGVVYLRDESGTRYNLQCQPDRFRSLGIQSSWPRYDSEIGLELSPGSSVVVPALPVAPLLDVSGEGWNSRGSDRNKSWKRDGEELSSRVLCPLGWSTPEERVQSEIQRSTGAEVQALQLPGTLQGKQLSWSRDGVRHEAIYVYTTGLLWELTYTAAADHYQPAHAAWLRQALDLVQSWT